LPFVVVVVVATVESCLESPVDTDAPQFVYRVENDDARGNLTGVIDFCSELGGQPVYANNAYEWQIIQGKQ
jgi:hypothetical protein